MYLISPEKKQYKANLHCHSTLSDGKRTPEELKKMYKDKGYSILSITDHEYPKTHHELNDDNFLTITGYEAYIRTNADCRSNKYDKETHLNLFARDPENKTLICFNPKYCKYLTDEEKAKLEKAGSRKTREHSVEYINDFIKTARENGYIVSYNHAVWNMDEEANVLKYEGYFSMEMCNYSSYLRNPEYNACLYDKMLRCGKRVFCHSADDNHNSFPDDSLMCDSFGGFAMIVPDEFTYDSVFSAIEKGDMYSSMGPVFKEVSINGNVVHVECSDVEKIIVFTGSKSPKVKYADIGGTVCSADIEIDDICKYFRVSIVDKYRRFADTRGFFRDEWENN